MNDSTDISLQSSEETVQNVESRSFFSENIIRFGSKFLNEKFELMAIKLWSYLAQKFQNS